MTFLKTTAMAVVGASLFASSAFSQQAAPAVRPNPQPQPQVQPQPQPQNPRQPANQVRPGAVIQQQTTNYRGAQSQMTEHSLASCIAIGNQEEIAISQFAWEKAKHSNVKQFAKMMVDDHQAFLKKLQRFAPEAAADGYLDQTVVQNTTQPAGAQPRQVVQQTAAQNEGQPAAGFDMIQLHREMAQQCLADARKKMSEKDGDKFDACFIGHQIAAHEAMKTKLTVFQRHASGEFAQLLADGLETTEKHLSKAEKIMDQLAGDKQERASNDK